MVSSFFICKQPLIYDHIVHFNLLNIQRKKKKSDYSRIHNYNQDHLNNLNPRLVAACFIQRVWSSKRLNLQETKTRGK